MYRVMIVDDERLMREGIAIQLKHCKQHESLDTPVMADDGLTAQEQMKAYRPDIVFLDIKMPHMDGLTFLHWGREYLPNTQFIIVSGFGEFDFVQQALNEGAVGYLLKPVDLAALEKVLDKTFDSLKEHRRVARLEQEHERYCLNSSMAQAEHQLNAFFHAGSRKRTNIPLAVGERAVLFLIQASGGEPTGGDETVQDIFEAQLEFQNKVIACCNQVFGQEAVSVCDVKSEVGVMSLMSGALTPQSARYYAVELYEFCQKNNLMVSLGISAVSEELSSDMYQSAQRALDARVLSGRSGVFDNQKCISQVSVVRRDELETFAQMVELQDCSGALHVLRTMLDVELYDQGSAWQAFALLNRLAATAKQAGARVLHVPAGDDVRACVSAWADLENIYQSWVRQLFSSEDTDDQNARMIREITGYVDSHYAQSMSIKDWAGRYYLNPNYLAALFKGETGMTFGQYVTERRIEKACSLLKKTSASIQQIAEQVGFDDVSYFHRVFKKTTGKTPREYQTSAS